MESNVIELRGPVGAAPTGPAPAEPQHEPSLTPNAVVAVDVVVFTLRPSSAADLHPSSAADLKPSFAD